MNPRSKLLRLTIGVSALLVFLFFQGASTDACSVCATDLLEDFGWIKVTNISPYFIMVSAISLDQKSYAGAQSYEYTVRNDPPYIKFDVPTGDYMVMAFRIHPVDKSLKYIDSYFARVKTGDIAEITVNTPMAF
jgi:hypothetical protein